VPLFADRALAQSKNALATPGQAAVLRRVYHQVITGHD